MRCCRSQGGQRVARSASVQGKPPQQSALGAPGPRLRNAAIKLIAMNIKGIQLWHFCTVPGWQGACAQRAPSLRVITRAQQPPVLLDSCVHAQCPWQQVAPRAYLSAGSGCTRLTASRHSCPVTQAACPPCKRSRDVISGPRPQRARAGKQTGSSQLVVVEGEVAERGHCARVGAPVRDGAYARGRPG